MPRYLFTILAFIAFIIAMGFQEYDLSHSVSQITGLADYRVERSVKPGPSSDGALFIAEIIAPPRVSHYAQVSNHGRTLRAFIAPNRTGVSQVYVEQIKPHAFFGLEGAFSVLPETVSFSWMSPSQLVFYGTSPDGSFRRYLADLHTPALSSVIADPSAVSKVMPVDMDPE